MRKATVIYAPNQAELGNVLRRLKTKNLDKLRMYLDRCFLFYTPEDLRMYYAYENDNINPMRKNSISRKTFEDYCILAGIKESVENLLFRNGYQISKENNALHQACMMALLTIEYFIVAEENNLSKREEDSIFYAGCSFGEFWALEHLVEEYPIYSILLAYKRGKAMMEITEKYNKKFAKLLIRPDKLKKQEQQFYNRLDLASIPKCIGKLILENEMICLFGKKEDLIFYAKGLNIKLIEAPIPFHSPYLFYAGNDFARLANQNYFMGEENSKAFITDKNAVFIPEILAQQFYASLDEKKLLQTIKEKVKEKGFESCTFLKL